MAIRLLAAGTMAALFGGSLLAQTICPPQIDWQQSLGTTESDAGGRILQMADGGFMVGGSSEGGRQGTKDAPNYGRQDFWLIRLNANGEKLWDKSYGGNQPDHFSDMDQTSDGGFILGGTSSSGISGNKTSPHYGQGDAWVVRVDAQGNKLWDKSFGGTGHEGLSVVKETADGGFIIGGGVQVPFGPFGATQGDFWVVRLDALGNQLWEAQFGGLLDESLSDAHQTADGGFVLGGWSSSTEIAIYGGSDYWLVRLDSSGNKLWDRAYGGSDSDSLRTMHIAANGDLLLAGQSNSDVSGIKTAPRFGYSSDFWVLRLDPEGNILWQAVYGGDSYEDVASIASVGTNAFLLTGLSYSEPSGTKTGLLMGGYDYWVLKIDGVGRPIWDASFGGLDGDTAADVIPTADSGYIVAGSSSGTGGNKTSPFFGSSDIWLVKLRLENPSDCDNDGVPNAQDSCMGTPPGALVNSNGCTLEQLCPCHGWLAHSEYVECIERVSAEFESAGLITSQQRADLLESAQDADCPPSFVAFGLVHLPMKDTLFDDMMFRSGTNVVFGTSILLGEADSGIFINPEATEWGNADPQWFMEGKAYGQLANGSNALVASVRGSKPGVETYPVDVDFTPLGATGLTFQFFLEGRLVKEDITTGSVGSVTIRTANDLGPSVNPFWRTRDGSVGTLIEFAGYAHYDGDDGGDDAYDRIFVRADGATQQVNYVSMVEVTGSRELGWYQILDEGLGMFGNRHGMLGEGLFQAADGRLTIERPRQSDFGTRIDFDRTAQFEVDLLPIDLTTNENRLMIMAAEPDITASVQIVHSQNALTLRAGFWTSSATGDTTQPPAVVSVELQAFRNGLPAGSCVAANDSVIGHFVISNQPAPRIIGCAAAASSNAPPAIAFSVDQLATFICTNGAELRGTHFRLAPFDSEVRLRHLRALSLVMGNPGLAPDDPGAFTITAERSEPAQPRLSIAAAGDTIILTWPDNTRLFRLESSTSLPNGFTTVPTEPDFANNQNRIILPREATGSRFFRLTSGPD